MKMFMCFTDKERTALMDAATVLLNMTAATKDVSSELSEKFDTAYELLNELLDLDGKGFDLE